jgi:hypothetical protein
LIGNEEPSVAEETIVVAEDEITSKIVILRGHKVMLDVDLAELYGVETKALNQAVTRNVDRFPDDFRFQLTAEEFREYLRSQFVTSKDEPRGGRRYLPYAFTEEGVAMLSSVLRSKRAIMVNIEIMRAFVRLRRILADHRELAQKIEELERKYDSQFAVVFEALRDLMMPETPTQQRIGFQTKETAPRESDAQ